jgi:UDP-N-acetyl-D-mannosaminuronate dehydrogenase
MEKVAVFGLGFVGLPLALTYAYKGCQVTGVFWRVKQIPVKNLMEPIWKQY